MDATDSEPTVSSHRFLTCSLEPSQDRIVHKDTTNAQKTEPYFSRTRVTFTLSLLLSVNNDSDIGLIGRSASQLLNRVNLQHELGLLTHSGL